MVEGGERNSPTVNLEPGPGTGKNPSVNGLENYGLVENLDAVPRVGGKPGQVYWTG